MVETINIVTACKRPTNVRRILPSIVRGLQSTTLVVRWVLVADEPLLWQAKAAGGRLAITSAVGHGPCKYGICQKNQGIDLIKAGWYYCLDDDNIVHPDFFTGVEQAMRANPGKRAFVFGQQRWDGVGSLKADPQTFLPGHVDNSMFVVHMDVIGTARYNRKLAGYEDYYFFRALYDANQGAFVFLPQTLAYYNYLRDCPALKG